MSTKRLFISGLLILGLIVATLGLSNIAPSANAADGWRGWERLSGETSTKPDITVHNGRLYAAIQALDNKIYYSYMDANEKWSSWKVIHPIKMAEVRMASSKDLVFFARSNDSQLYYAIETKNQVVPLVGYWRLFAKSDSSPSALMFDGKLYVFYRGKNNGVFMSTGKDYKMFKDQYEIPGNMRTTAGPEATVHNNRIFLAVRSNDNRIFVNIFDKEWRGWREVPGNGRTPSSPAICSVNGNIYMMMRGTDNKIYVNQYNNRSWSGWNRIDGQTASGPSLAEFRGRLYAIIRGTDKRLYINSLTPDRWDDRRDRDRDDRNHDGWDLDDRRDRDDRDRGDRDRDDRDRGDKDRDDRDRGDRDRDDRDRGDKDRPGRGRDDDQQRLDAKIVNVSFPDSVKVNETFTVSITVRNTGDTTWTRKMEIKLGAVGDSDPFSTNRILLGENDTIRTNQTKTFTFTMKAPNNPGSYTTDWQMVQEKVRWFGDVFSKTIEVRRARRD